MLQEYRILDFEVGFFMVWCCAIIRWPQFFAHNSANSITLESGYKKHHLVAKIVYDNCGDTWCLNLQLGGKTCNRQSWFHPFYNFSTLSSWKKWYQYSLFCYHMFFEITLFPEELQSEEKTYNPVRRNYEKFPSRNLQIVSDWWLGRPCINYTWKGRASSLATKCSLMLVVRHKTAFGWDWALIICQCFHVKPAQIECWNTQANQALCWGPVLNHNVRQLIQKQTFEEDFH